MALQDFTRSMVEKQWIKIITVDPRNRTIEGMLKDYGVIRIAVWDVPSGFQWPKENEVWLVVRENNDWFLRAPMQEPDAAYPIEDLDPGDTQLGSPGAKVNVLGRITVNGDPLAMDHIDGAGFEDGEIPVWDDSTDSWLANAANAHTHAESDVTGLVADLAAKQPLNTQLTAIAALTTTAFGRSLLTQADAVAASTALALPFVTSLPGSPVDGQVIDYLADAVLGIAWRLKYRAAEAGSFKWYFVGGGSLRHEVPATETRANAAYGDLTTVGPSITVPLAGDYEIAGGAHHMIAATGNSSGYAAVKVGAAATADADQVGLHDTAGIAGAPPQSASQARTLVKTGLAASTALLMQYRQSAGTGQWRDRWLSVRPIRVG